MRLEKFLLAGCSAFLFILSCKQKPSEGVYRKEELPPVSSSTTEALPDSLELGRALFEQNCSSCHELHKNGAGPALRGIRFYRSKDWLVQFTKNAPQMVNNRDSIAIRLFNEYKPVSMPAFEFLNDNEILWIYQYLKRAEEPVSAHNVNIP